MKIKTFLIYQLKSWLPVASCCLFFFILLEILVTLYRISQALVTDTLRFGLPFLLLWALGDSYLSWKKVQAIRKEERFLPSSPVELALSEFQRAQLKESQQQIRQLTHRQQHQLEQLELYSHEIKNSLTSLQAAAENQSQVPSQTILTAISQADYQLNMMLSDERLSLSNNNFDFEWINLSRLVNTIIQDNSALFINHQLIPELTGLDHIRVLTDRKWLHFCISQLLSNAIKYSPTSATIKVSWSANALHIVDEGPGISSADLPRIYENGFSGHNGHQTTKSTGMGLYLVKKVTNRLNFSVQVVSQQGQGTVERLRFPSANIRQ